MQLFELGLGLFVASLILASGVAIRPDSGAHRCDNAAQMVGEFLWVQRREAMLVQEDRSILATPPNSIVVSETGRGLDLPVGVVVLAAKRFGFKPDGRTKYANTLTIQCGDTTRRLSLGVGYGRVRLL